MASPTSAGIGKRSSFGPLAELRAEVCRTANAALRELQPMSAAVD